MWEDGGGDSASYPITPEIPPHFCITPLTIVENLFKQKEVAYAGMKVATSLQKEQGVYSIGIA